MSGNMFAGELQSSGAWQPCKWRCPSWEREFLFPRQLKWAWGLDGAYVRGVGETRGAAQGCWGGPVQSLLWRKPLAGQGQDWSGSHQCLCILLTSAPWQLVEADSKRAHKQRAQPLLLQQLTKELVPTPSSNLKTTVSPHSSCQNLQAPPQLP